MTTLVEGARRVLSGRSDLDRRVAALGEAVQHARGRLDDELLDTTEALVERASARLRLSSEHTVVALAGATGSGKSSTFNALAGLDLAAVGVRRPTTSWATACIWGEQGASELLEWLGIPLRHQVVRDSMLDAGREGRDLRGLVLLDLPDHDSTEVVHHLEVDRLIELTDVMVWVLDPQKYADAAIHDRFLRPLAAHRDVMVVVLNHLDEVPPARRESVIADVRRLLADDGLGGVPLIPISARTGEGVDDLRREIASRVADKATTRTRIGTDVTNAARRMLEVSGDTQAPRVGKTERTRLVEAIADSAGVPVVVDAVHRATRLRARRATGWPVTSWLSRLRPDPLKRLHLDLSRSQRDLVAAARSSLPTATPVQRAQVDTRVRELADTVTHGLGRPWMRSVRQASLARTAELGDSLDRVMTQTDLGVAAVPLWCRLVRALQWLLLSAAVVGAVWLGALAVMGYLRMPEPDTPRLGPLPVPTWLLVGGVVAGVVLAFVCRGLVALSARGRAARAERRLRAGVAEVVEDLVVAPVEAELAAYKRTQTALRTPAG